MMTSNDERHRVLALYKFVKISPEKVPALKGEIESHLRQYKARGTILLACEGINGTICYPERLAIKDGCDIGDSSGESAQDSIVEFFQKNEFFAGLRTRISYVPNSSIFHRLKVKVKKEIVTMTGENDDQNENGNALGEESHSKKKTKTESLHIDPTEVVGTHVKPDKWDELLMDPDVVVIDTRNKYEIDIGTFQNAISPNTNNFRQFPDWLQRFSKECSDIGQCHKSDESQKEEQCVVNSEDVCTTLSSNNPRSTEPVTTMPKIRRKPKAVAMFCTGGIRCEKSTSFALAAKVFEPDVPVYHLDGGILAYLDSRHDPNQSKWKGECFVFDQRVALTHGLKPSQTFNNCHACRKPLSDEDRKGKDYLHGVHCKHCKGSLTDKQLQRLKDRQKQIELAEKKGVAHIHDPKELQ